MNLILRQQKIFFIVNARAGGGKARDWWLDTIAALEQQGVPFFWQYSGGGEKTSRQVREAVLYSQATVVVAVGGDGHVHDVVNGLVEQGALIAPGLVFALYPAGTGCDLARMVYINKGDTSSGGLLNLLTNGEIRHVDVGRAAFVDFSGQPREAYFLNGGDIGLGAQTCQIVNARGGLLKAVVKDGKLAFLLASLQALLRYYYTPVSIEADGEQLQGHYLIAAVGNGCYMGGNMRLFPRARLDDGQLDLLLVDGLTKLKTLLLMRRVYSGDILGIKGVDYRQVKSVVIRPQRPLPLELDGELPGLAPVSINVLPGLLPLLCFSHRDT